VAALTEILGKISGGNLSSAIHNQLCRGAALSQIPLAFGHSRTESAISRQPWSMVNAVPFSGGVDLNLGIAPNPPYTGFNECFANGVPPNQAAVLSAVQRPAALAQLGEPSGPPAWANIPSWSLIGTEDHAVPPSLQEQMSTNAGAHISFVKAGHLSLITRPNAVVDIIDDAVHATG
jgi:pimeloyl-ACP methyl ester carboxylesterase